MRIESFHRAIDGRKCRNTNIPLEQSVRHSSLKVSDNATGTVPAVMVQLLEKEHATHKLPTHKYLLCCVASLKVYGLQCVKSRASTLQNRRRDDDEYLISNCIEFVILCAGFGACMLSWIYDGVVILLPRLGDNPLTVKAMQTIVADITTASIGNLLPLVYRVPTPSSFEILTLVAILKAKNIMNS
ncbi:hypothetical protein C5167_023318 [Papaver somniferum]|uniref:Uncharacterized protein n=1 Tax=Papaver somniferum TaxID=3469 RepID=A0A4Y7JLW2_PAPSO|nr:hypothetical protein C5167_023318 [Papaver somniferum]